MSRVARVVPFERVQPFQAHIDPPFPGESLLGFVTRALSVTVAKRLSIGLALGGIDESVPLSIAMKLTDEQQIAGIAKLFQTTPDRIRERVCTPCHFDHSSTKAVDFFGVKIRFHYREKSVRRVAPRALKLVPYHRAIWELRPFIFDPQTRERLLDICPVCNQKLGWLTTLGPTKCDHCRDERGFPSVDLRDFPQPILDVEDGEALDFVTGLVGPDPERKAAARRLLPEQWAKFSNGDVFETVMALASGLTLDPSAKFHKKGRAKEFKRFAMLTPDLLALAGRAIIGGEAGFSALAGRYRLDMDKRANFYGVWKELGHLVQTRSDESIHPKIRKHLSDLIEADMKKNGRRRLRPPKDYDDGYQPIKWLADKAQLRRQRFQLLAESGFVDTVRAPKAKKSPVRLPAAEVLQLVPQLRDAILPREAAGAVGVHLQALPALERRKLIKRLEGPVLGFIPGRAAFSISSVNELIRKIWERAIMPVPQSAVRLSQAARHLANEDAPWDAIISAIVAGDIAVYGDPEKRGRLGSKLSVTSSRSFVEGVRKHLRKPSERVRWIGVDAAGEILKVTSAFVPRLARERPDLLKAKKAGYAPYLRDDVLKIAKKYIFVPEIRDRAGMTSRGVAIWLRKLGTETPIKLQENKDFGYYRSEIENLLAAQEKENARRSAELKAAPDNPRTRVLRAVADGKTTRLAAKEFGIPYGTAHNWVSEWRATGSLGNKQRRSQLNEHRQWLDRLLARKPNITSGQILKAFKDQRHVNVSRNAIDWYLECHRVPLEKRRRIRRRQPASIWSVAAE